MLGGGFGNAVYHFNGCLVVAVEEVDFKTFDAHGGVLFASNFQLAVEYVEYCPEYEFHSFLLSVSDQFRKVQFGNDGQHITAFGVVPAFVEHNKLDTVAAGEIYIIFVGIHVDTCLEGDTFQIPVIPPVPGHFPGFYPGSVAYAVGGCQCINQIVDGHIRIFFRHSQHTPGIRTGTFAAGYEIGCLCHILLSAPGIEICLGGVGGKYSFQGVS